MRRAIAVARVSLGEQAGDDWTSLDTLREGDISARRRPPAGYGGT